MSSAQTPEFVDVKDIHPVNSGTHWRTDMRETLTVRDHNGGVTEVLTITPDGNFRGSFGKVRREDVGEYILRISGRMPC